MTQRELIQHLKTGRLLIIILICAQILTTTYIVKDSMQEKENQLNNIICNQELIPLETIPFEEIE